MKTLLHVLLGAIVLLVPTGFVTGWELSARHRLSEAAAVPETREVAIAAAADEGYCTPELKKILRRVLQSCGLQATGSVRGCQPVEAKNVATLSGDDFNALFVPLANRAGIIQYDQDSAEIDAGGLATLDRVFSDQRGASYFFVVSRSSPEGSEIYNRDLSERRGKAVLDHLRQNFADPDLDKEVGLLWLGEEYAQLDDEFCQWQRSRPTEECTGRELNRSAFVAWIDCRI